MASSILNAFSRCGWASCKAAAAAVRKVRRWRLANERGFGLGGAPGFGSHAAQGDACPRHVPARDREHDGRRR